MYKKSLRIAVLCAFLAGCGEREVKQPIAQKEEPRERPKDLVLFMVDGGSSHPDRFRLPGPSLALFDSGLAIRSTSFPESADVLQTLRVDQDAVYSILSKFRRLESSARGQQVAAPGMSLLEVSALVDKAGSIGWRRVDFAFGDVTKQSESAVFSGEVILMREIINDVRNMNWSEAAESSREEVELIKRLR